MTPSWPAVSSPEALMTTRAPRQSYASPSPGARTNPLTGDTTHSRRPASSTGPESATAVRWGAAVLRHGPRFAGEYPDLERSRSGRCRGTDAVPADRGGDRDDVPRPALPTGRDGGTMDACGLGRWRGRWSSWPSCPRPGVDRDRRIRPPRRSRRQLPASWISTTPRTPVPASAAASGVVLIHEAGSRGLCGWWDY